MPYDHQVLILPLIDVGSGAAAGITRLRTGLLLLERDYDLRPADGTEPPRAGAAGLPSIPGEAPR